MLPGISKPLSHSEPLSHPESLSDSDRDRVPHSVSGETNAGERALSPARGFAGLIAANISLIVAIMVYMGWAYESAYYGYFHLDPLDIGVSPQDYLLFSLNLFNPVVVVAVVVVIAAIVTVTRGAALVSAAAAAVVMRAASLVRTDPRLQWVDERIPHGSMKRLTDMKQRWWKPRAILVGLGVATTGAALVLYAIAGYAPVSTYLILTLLALGPLLLTWALRGNRQGRLAYSLAIVVFIVCSLWAGALYANGRGNSAAHDFAGQLLTKTEVALYSVEPLAMSGTGLSVQKLPAAYLYHYRYEGLRLLYMNSGTYYLLPAGWTPQLPLTFIISTSDETNVELY